MFVLKIADRWKKFPSEVEEQDQSMLGHLEHEQMVLQALRRHDG